MSENDHDETEAKVAEFYAQERAQKMERPEGCICRWEYSPVMIEGPDENDLFSRKPSRYAFQSTVFYREVKHYIEPGCEVHNGLLKVTAQKMVDAFKQQYPEVLSLARKLGLTKEQKEQKEQKDQEAGVGKEPLTEVDDAVYFEFQTYRLRVPKAEVEKGMVDLSLGPRAEGERVEHPWPAYQFFDAVEGAKWASEQAAWLVWKWFDDDPFSADEKQGPSGKVYVRNSWLTRWEREDEYFWPLESTEKAAGHCAKCHHVCSRFCGRESDGGRQVIHDPTCSHTFGCPEC